MLAVSAPPEAALSFAVSLHLRNAVNNAIKQIWKEKTEFWNISSQLWSPPEAGEEDYASGEDAECERCRKGDNQVEPVKAQD